MSSPRYTPNNLGSPFSFAGDSSNSSSISPGRLESNDLDFEQESEENGRGRISKPVQREKDWNEEDSVRLVRAYAWKKPNKKGTATSILF
jgi:hypothetical protein